MAPTPERAAQLARDIVEHTGEVAYRYRLWPTLGYEFVSDSVTALLGFTADELYADPMLAASLVYPDDRDAMEALLEAPADQELEIELRWIRRDGRVVRTALRYVLSRDATGRPTRIDGIARGVTWRGSRQEQRLQLVQQRARATETPGTTRPIRVLIADDHDLARYGVCAMLADADDIQVVGQASDGREAVGLARALEPDLVLMDVRMPVLDGLQATRELKHHCPMTSVLILSMFGDVDLLREAVKAGAVGYVRKDASETSLRAAIHDALRGDLPIDTLLAREVLRQLADEQPRPPVLPPADDPLSAREHEVLVLLARGLTNREIAEELIVTPHTVKIHVEHILAKLGVSDRTQAAVYAIQCGYIAPDIVR